VRGGHARACIDALENQQQYRIAGLVGSKAEIGSQHFGHAVLGSDDDLPRLTACCEYALIAVGHIQTADVRRRLYAHMLELGFKLPVIVASTAYVSPHARIGAGSVVMHGAIVNTRQTYKVIVREILDRWTSLRSLWLGLAKSVLFQQSLLEIPASRGCAVHLE
jgi:acetyltransferase-like isoleucine patch superfamily enzyme